ncbi:MAG: hypothetical protein KTR31_33230 [Myxococcales bacterium]|nr:hypothetical protein [Myxococcales bacterium]
MGFIVGVLGVLCTLPWGCAASADDGLQPAEEPRPTQRAAPIVRPVPSPDFLLDEAMFDAEILADPSKCLAHIRARPKTRNLSPEQIVRPSKLLIEDYEASLPDPFSPIDHRGRIGAQRASKATRCLAVAENALLADGRTPEDELSDDAVDMLRELVAHHPDLPELLADVARRGPSDGDSRETLRTRGGRSVVVSVTFHDPISGTPQTKQIVADRSLAIVALDPDAAHLGRLSELLVALRESELPPVLERTPRDSSASQDVIVLSTRAAVRIEGPTGPHTQDVLVQASTGNVERVVVTARPRTTDRAGWSHLVTLIRRLLPLPPDATSRLREMVRTGRSGRPPPTEVAPTSPLTLAQRMGDLQTRIVVWNLSAIDISGPRDHSSQRITIVQDETRYRSAKERHRVQLDTHARWLRDWSSLRPRTPAQRTPDGRRVEGTSPSPQQRSKRPSPIRVRPPIRRPGK